MAAALTCSATISAADSTTGPLLDEGGGCSDHGSADGETDPSDGETDPSDGETDPSDGPPGAAEAFAALAATAWRRM